MEEKTLSDILKEKAEFYHKQYLWTKEKLYLKTKESVDTQGVKKAIAFVESKQSEALKRDDKEMLSACRELIMIIRKNS